MALKPKKTKQTTEFGDFQTPLALAQVALKVLADLGMSPRSILEPTCGRGAFVAAAAEVFPAASAIIGVEINKSYLDCKTGGVFGCRRISRGRFFQI